MHLYTAEPVLMTFRMVLYKMLTDDNIFRQVRVYSNHRNYHWLLLIRPYPKQIYIQTGRDINFVYILTKCAMKFKFISCSFNDTGGIYNNVSFRSKTPNLMRENVIKVGWEVFIGGRGGTKEPREGNDFTNNYNFLNL